MSFTIITGDCLDTLRDMKGDSIDAIVTDPPYGLSNHKPAEVAAIVAAWATGQAADVSGRGFMGKEWDAFVPGPEVWRECLRVLKPGGHMCVFAGSRTVDLMGLSVRLAGFEIRDQLQWIYGSGFPKSTKKGALPGWGTALKPAHEPIIMARKPLIGTVARNVEEYGTGGINVDGCRVGKDKLPAQVASQARLGTFERADMIAPEREGRWPANIILDEKAGEILDGQSGVSRSTNRPRYNKPSMNNSMTGANCGHISGGHNDSGGASRFFFNASWDPGGRGFERFRYCAKASKGEREAGLEDFDEVAPTDVTGRKPGSAGQKNPRAGMRGGSGRKNTHPTVKPLSLMRWLVRLITPPGGVVLDPFTGSGSTGCAAALEGFEFLGCELSEEYVKIAKARIEHWRKEQ